MKGFLFLVSFFLCLNLYAKTYEDIFNVTLLSVYDGDTIKVNIEDYPDIIGSNISIRLRGIDAPEIRGGTEVTKLKARESRDALARLLEGKVIVLRNVGRGSFFRIIADVYIGDMNVSQFMLKKGYAVLYKSF